jgi:hypothetical protein
VRIAQNKQHTFSELTLSVASMKEKGLTSVKFENDSCFFLLSSPSPNEPTNSVALINASIRPPENHSLSS